MTAPLDPAAPLRALARSQPDAWCPPDGWIYVLHAHGSLLDELVRNGGVEWPMSEGSPRRAVQVDEARVFAMSAWREP